MSIAIATRTPLEVRPKVRIDLDPELIQAWLNDEISVDRLPEPPWGPIGREVYERTYSRDVPIVGASGAVLGTRKEVWAETVRRVVLGSLSYVDQEHVAETEAIELFDTIFNLRAIPAGRHLWVTGTPVASFSKNCWSAGFAKRTSAHFSFLAARLFEGGGVGANYSQDLLSVTDPIIGQVSISFTCSENHGDYERVRASAGSLLNRASDERAGQFGMLVVGLTDEEPAEIHRVDDSREGWIAVWTRLIDLATQRGYHRLIVDVSDVRPHGQPLRTFGGTASGPDALIQSLLAIQGVLSGASAHGSRQLTGLEAMQIDHELAASVISGGSRRSARIALMSWKDPSIFAFIHCKADHMHHWTTNISVEIDNEFHEALADTSHPLNALAEKVLQEVAVGMTNNGEPGFVDTDAHSADEPNPIRITNPCSEASLFSQEIDGKVAGESCNLGSVDLDAFGADDWAAARAFELMARFLYRATLNAHRDPMASTIEAENRRIGVGIMGLQGWVAGHGYKLTELASTPGLQERLSWFRWVARDAADALADELGLPRPVKVTAVAPTGTIAQLRGTTPGIHPVFARWFIRRVRYSRNSPALHDLRAAGFNVVPDIYAADTDVVEFIVRDGILDHQPLRLIEQTDEIDAADFFDIIATVQRTFCGEGDGQAVSATAQIPSGLDPQVLAEDIRGRLGSMKGFTVFPAVSRPLAPYEVISEAEYLAAVISGSLVQVGDSNSGECVGAACPIK